MSVRFQPFDPVFLQDPYPTYEQLRTDSPVHRVRIGPLTVWRLARRFAQMRRESGEPGLLRTAWAMRKEMSRLSSGTGVFFGFGRGCFTGGGVLVLMAASRHRQPRAALATTSQRGRVCRVREALV